MAQYKNPVYAEYFADPFVWKHNQIYYAVGTGRFDTHDAAGKSIRFDGNWREDRMSEKDYMTLFSQADEAYVSALTALVNELKKSS